jgi:hypothetical protein
MTVDELVKSAGVDIHEIREKHRLIELIKKARRENVPAPAHKKNRSDARTVCAD